jgi:hypothetical protein
MERHQFTPEERRRGGKRRQQRQDAREHQRYAYQMLQLRKPGVAMFIYEQIIKPRYKREGSPEE